MAKGKIIAETERIRQDVFDSVRNYLISQKGSTEMIHKCIKARKEGATKYHEILYSDNLIVNVCYSKFRDTNKRSLVGVELYGSDKQVSDAKKGLENILSNMKEVVFKDEKLEILKKMDGIELARFYQAHSLEMRAENQVYPLFQEEPEQAVNCSLEKAIAQLGKWSYAIMIPANHQDTSKVLALVLSGKLIKKDDLDLEMVKLVCGIKDGKEAKEAVTDYRH